jgi:hypothetical protein
VKNSLIVSVIVGISVLGLSSNVAGAWYYRLSGSGTCQPDGSYKITWKVDNTSEPSALDVYESSYPSVVPTGQGVVAKHSAKSFTQIVDGTTPATYTLTLKADWQGDRSRQVKSATVKLNQPCEQPIVPEVPEEPQDVQDGEVLGEQVTVIPVGAVNAGEGKSTAHAGIVAGVISGILVLAYGVARSLKSPA